MHLLFVERQGRHLGDQGLVGISMLASLLGGSSTGAQVQAGAERCQPEPAQEAANDASLGLASKRQHGGQWSSSRDSRRTDSRRGCRDSRRAGRGCRRQDARRARLSLLAGDARYDPTTATA